MFRNPPVNLPGSDGFWFGWLLIIKSVSSIDTDLFRLSVSSHVGHSNFCLLTNLSILPRLSSVWAEFLVIFFYCPFSVHRSALMFFLSHLIFVTCVLSLFLLDRSYGFHWLFERIICRFYLFSLFLIFEFTYFCCKHFYSLCLLWI